MIEFAVVVGLLLYLILGVVSYGVLLAVRHGLDEAAGEAARAATLTWDDAGTPADERVEAARASLTSAGVACAPDGPVSCDVQIAACAGEGAPCVTVTLVHDREVDSLVGRLPILEAVLPDMITARASAVVNP